MEEAPTVSLTNAVTALAEDADTSSAIKVADIMIGDHDFDWNALDLAGADAALFYINSIDHGTAELFLKAGAALDFETNPSLDVTVAVDDPAVGTLPDDTAALTIAVTDVAEPVPEPVIALSAIEAGDGSDGFVLNGVSAGDQSGYAVSSAGDVNGDGFDDLIIGARAAAANGGAAASYVVFGAAGGFGSSLELSALDGSNGFVLGSLAASHLDTDAISSAGDVNGDGYDDLIVGAMNDDPNGVNSGASFVVFGADFSNVVDTVGTAGAEVLIGGSGDDTLEGGSGSDTFVFASGDGEDVLLDFETGTASAPVVDVIAVSGFAGVTGFGDLDSTGDQVLDAADAAASISAGRLEIDFGAGDVLQVSGVTSLTENDFLFS